MASDLRGGPAAPKLVAGSLAWAITVAPAAFGRGAPLTSAFFAVLALGGALAGPPLLRLRPRLARHVGISLFLGASTASWLAGAAALHPMRLDPGRGVFGAIAWGVFALAWSDRWTKRNAPVPRDPDAPLLLARAGLPLLASPIAAAGVAASLAFLGFAFSVRDPDRALAAQMAALLASVLMVSAAATVAVARGAARSPAGRKLTPTVVRALLLLVAFSVAGAVAAALR